MDTQEYLKSRLEDQIFYYSGESKKNKKKYHGLKIAEIAISIGIPFLSGYLNSHEYIKYTIGGLGVILAFLTSLQVLCKYQDKWITYRNTSESLKQEKYMFLSAAGPYRNDQTVSALSERVEVILAKENSNWSGFMSKNEAKK
jgi:hypothetical protein